MKKFVFTLLGLMFTLNCMSQLVTVESDKKEYMFFVYSDGNRVADMASAKQQLHIQKIGAYIETLAKTGKLKDAQPLEMEGTNISTAKGKIQEDALKKNKKVIAGYYHVLAKDMIEAIEIAKSDPRFEEEGWEIEIRPIKKVVGIN